VLDATSENRYSVGMKSCFGMLLALVLFILVIGGGGLIWYLSETAEFSRTGENPPVAVPVDPQR